MIKPIRFLRAALGTQYSVRENRQSKTFIHDLELAYGFYEHRLKNYRKTVPHHGFGILREIAAYLPDNAFILANNVDEKIQKAG